MYNFALYFKEFFGRIYYLGPLREYPRREYTWAGNEPYDMGQRGGNFIDSMLAAKERGNKISRGKGRKMMYLSEYVADWLQKLGLIYEFEVKPITEGSNLYQVWVKKNSKSAKVLLTDVGFGVSQILPVITLCYYAPEGSTILLEQPEIHLHPSVQSGLADVFIDAVNTRNVQIIVESHSEYLLKRLQLRIAQKEINNSDVSLYFCDLEEEHSVLKNLKLDLFGNITNWPRDFFGDQFGEEASRTRAIIERRKNC